MVRARWADGAEAPLPDATPTTISAPMTYGSVRYQGAGATSFTVPYRPAAGGSVTYYYSNTVPPPLCDTPVTVTASAGGLTGTGVVTLRGSSTAGPNALSMSATPDSLSAGDEAAISGSARSADGGDVSAALAGSTPMLLTIASGTLGWLAYGGQTGTSLQAVPFAALRAGAVRFVADSTRTPLLDTPISISASGGGLTGATVVVVRGESCSAKVGGQCSLADHLAVTPTPPELVYGNAATVFVEARAGDEPGALDPAAPVTVSASTTRYGTLLSGTASGSEVTVAYSVAHDGGVSYSTGLDPAVERPLYDVDVQIAASSGDVSGQGSLVIDGALEYTPCNTGNPLIDDPNVQALFRQLWEESHYDDRMGGVKPLEDRRERVGLAYAVGLGYGTRPIRQQDYDSGDSDYYAEWTARGLNASYTPVHTHPMAFDERDFVNTNGARNNSQPSTADYETMDALYDAFRIEYQLIIDATHIFIHNRYHRTQLEPRCGY